MTKVFLDTNIILDYILSRDIAGASAEQIFERRVHGEILCYIAAHTLTNIFYILRKEYDVPTRKLIIKSISALCSVVPIDEEIMNKALTDTRFDDLEDAIQMQAAELCKADIFVTRDVKGFKKSKIKVSKYLQIAQK